MTLAEVKRRRMLDVAIVAAYDSGRKAAIAECAEVAHLNGAIDCKYCAQIEKLIREVE